jgi:peptide/nickel transport system substrate-binding protein
MENAAGLSYAGNALCHRLKAGPTMRGEGNRNMRRRSFLAAATAGLALPAIARAQGSSTIRFVPEADLVLLDPVVTPAAQTREHAYLVYDTLFGIDDSFQAHPQMVQGSVTENDGKLWRLTLRDGLKFHDGTPVLARDCAASIRRWGARDAFGQALMAATDEICTDGDKVITVRLKHPFPLLPDALAKPMAFMCPMMPERLAKTDPYKAVTEPIGSGPYRFKADERVPGARVVYERFAGYVPRQDGVPETTAGPKRPVVDRIEWVINPDNTTAVAALQRGEVDWVQTPAPDLLPQLRADKNITARIIAPTGLIAYIRFNQLIPPFDNPALRRAIIGAVSQADYMVAINGEDKTLWRDDVGYFCPGVPLASDAGMEALTGKRDYDAVKRAIEASGYKGERIAMMVAVDVLYLKLMGDVTADVFKKIGLNLDYQPIDWTTLVQRRIKMDPTTRAAGTCSLSTITASTRSTRPGICGCAATAATRRRAGRPAPGSRACAMPGSTPAASRRSRRSRGSCSFRRSRTCRIFRWVNPLRPRPTALT